ncbi:MAG: glycosyltransferase family 4 protein [Ilumatobacteraceae bacterium]
MSYRRAAGVTVLSEDLAANVRAKLGRQAGKVHVIPNFVDVAAIRPTPRATQFRREQGIGDEPVVMYAGNVGFSQSLDLLVAAARQMPEVTFVINGDGSAKADLVTSAAGLGNVRFTGYQPKERLNEVLATGDVHVVPLRAGLGAVSVPSKTYSILAAGRPVVAAIDPGTEVPRILAASGGGVAVGPDDPDAFVAGLCQVLGEPGFGAARGAAGRAWVEQAVSPAAVATAYEDLIAGLIGRRGR